MELFQLSLTLRWFTALKIWCGPIHHTTYLKTSVLRLRITTREGWKWALGFEPASAELFASLLYSHSSLICSSPLWICSWFCLCDIQMKVLDAWVLHQNPALRVLQIQICGILNSRGTVRHLLKLSIIWMVLVLWDTIYDNFRLRLEVPNGTWSAKIAICSRTLV